MNHCSSNAEPKDELVGLWRYVDAINSISGNFCFLFLNSTLKFERVLKYSMQHEILTEKEQTWYSFGLLK